MSQENSVQTPVSVPTTQKSNKPSIKNRKPFTNSSLGRRTKRRGKKQRGPKPAPVVRRPPVKEYTSQCCGAPANKPRLEKSRGEKEETFKGLGKWRCSICRKRCKVTAATPKPVVVDMSGVENTVIKEITVEVTQEPTNEAMVQQ